METASDGTTLLDKRKDNWDPVTDAGVIVTADRVLDDGTMLCVRESSEVNKSVSVLRGKVVAELVDPRTMDTGGGKKLNVVTDIGVIVTVDRVKDDDETVLCVRESSEICNNVNVLRGEVVWELLDPRTMDSGGEKKLKVLQPESVRNN